jgi:N-acetylneuraminic acid mutarotase
MQRKIAYIILLTTIIGCSENEYPHKFPIILTEEVTDINSQGARFSARIQNLDDFKINSYGFVWGQSDNPTLTSSKLSLSSDFKEGKFTEIIQNDLEEGKTYFVRGFIKTDKVIVYGDTKAFTSKGSLPPSISGFSPTEGLVGTEITIKGENFSTNPYGNRVTIGGLEFDIVSSTKNELIVKQPVTELTGSFPVTIEVAGQSATSPGNYLIIGPTIESISKLTARVGDLLTLNGKFFSQSLYSYLYFGAPEYGNSCEPVAISDSQSECYVPDYAGNTGKLKLFSYLENEVKSFEFAQQFTIVDSWQKRASSTPLEEYVGFTHAQMDNLVYMIGGSTMYEYNLSTRVWTKKQDFAGPYRFQGTAFTLNGKLYYGFGQGANGQYYNDLWSYNPATNSWTSFGTTPLGNRSGAVAVTINNKVYLGFGGASSPSTFVYTDFWQFDGVANSWTEVSTSGIEQGNFAGDPIAFVAGNKAYFVDLHLSDQPYTSTVLEFDPATGQWTRKSDLNDWTTSGPASGMSNHGLVICNANGPTRTWEYDPAKDVWIKRQTLHAGIAPLKFGAFHEGKFHLGGTEVWELSFD